MFLCNKNMVTTCQSIKTSNKKRAFPILAGMKAKAWRWGEKKKERKGTAAAPPVDYCTPHNIKYNNDCCESVNSINVYNVMIWIIIVCHRITSSALQLKSSTVQHVSFLFLRCMAGYSCMAQYFPKSNFRTWKGWFKKPSRSLWGRFSGHRDVNIESLLKA